MKKEIPEGCAVGIALILLVLLLLFSFIMGVPGCAPRGSHYQQTSKKFIVTSIQDSSMKLDGRWPVHLCNGCKVGDTIVAWRIGR